jgi:hypothetical protein
MTDRGRPASTLRRALTTATRYAGALALLAVGLDHLQQYAEDSYSVIPTIGTLFALNFASASVITAGLFAPVQKLPGRAGRVAVPLLALSGIGVAAGSLAGLFASETSGLFGFMETGYRSAIVISIALEAATIALLGAHLVLRREIVLRLPRTLRSQPPRIS